MYKIQIKYLFASKLKDLKYIQLSKSFLYVTYHYLPPLSPSGRKSFHYDSETAISLRMDVPSPLGNEKHCFTREKSNTS